MISAGYKQTVKLVRETMEKCDTFDCAYHMLVNEAVATSGYFILTGTKDNEGVVISRNRTGADNVANITDENWYLVQTNEDHFAGQCYDRCQAARANFEKLGRENLNVDSGFDSVLMVAPNLNHNSIYGIKMVPKTFKFEPHIAHGTVIATDM